MTPYAHHLIACLLLAASAASSAAPQDDLPTASLPQQSLYRAGHSALDRRDWLGAVQQFRSLEAELARSRSAGRDAALYWQAYALDKSGDRPGAIGLSQKLLAEFPDSAWADDAEELLGGEAAGIGEGDRLMALDAMMVSAPEKAVPILTQVLAGDHNDRIKKRALFILVQIAPKAAVDAIEAILAGSHSIALKREAIQTLALAGDSAVIPRLIAYYDRENDAALKRAVIDAGLIGGHVDLVLAVARSESDAELQSHAIRVLGAMGQSAKVAELLPQLTDSDAQRSAVDALAIAGDADALAALVRSSAPVKVRVHAVRALNIVPAGRSVPVLIALYRDERDPDVRRTLLHALSSSDDAAALKAIGESLE